MNGATALILATSVALLGASIATLAEQDLNPSSAALMQSMESMMTHTYKSMTGDADKDVAMTMAVHHQGGIDTTKVELTDGKYPKLRDLAQWIIDAQERETRFPGN